MNPALRAMSEAPKNATEILAATSIGWLVVHYADGGGEDQPRFKGWFFWTGFDFRGIDSSTLLGWLPLPDLWSGE